MKIITFLRGRKTYIVGAMGVTSVALYGIGVIDYETMVAILGALGFTGLATLRDSISRLGK